MKISEPQGSQLEGRKEEGSTVHISNRRRRDYQIKLVHISLRQAKYSLLQQSCSSDVEFCHGVPQILKVYISSKKKSKTSQSKTTERKSHIGQLWTEGPSLALKVCKLQGTLSWRLYTRFCNCPYCCICLPCSLFLTLMPLAVISHTDCTSGQTDLWLNPVFRFFVAMKFPPQSQNWTNEGYASLIFFMWLCWLCKLHSMKQTKPCNFSNHTVIQFMVDYNSNL